MNEGSTHSAMGSNHRRRSNASDPTGSHATLHETTRGLREAETMLCEEVSGLLLDAQRGRLAPDVRAQMTAHLQTCRACFHEGGAEQLLTEALEGRLPRHAAPVALKRRLVAEWPGLVALESGAWERWGHPPRTGTASGRL